MEIKQLKVKILKHYQNTSEHNLNQGLTWYNRAYNECLLLSQVFEIPLPKVVGVVAAISPRNKWNNNLKDAWNLLDKPSLSTKVSTFMGQRKKALDILACDGDDLTIMKILGGQKTKNFYNNILHHVTSEAVTVDVWAFRSVGLPPTTKNFRFVEVAYRELANELKMQPHQLQAVVWGVVRGAIQ